jgi:hypothetical protein
LLQRMGGVMTMNIETIFEVRRIEGELRNGRIALLRRLGPLPERAPSSRFLSGRIRALVVRLRSVLAADREGHEERKSTSRTASGA